MTEAKRANWNSDGAKAARKIEDLFSVYVWPEIAGDAVEEVFETGRPEAAFLPIFARTLRGQTTGSKLRERKNKHPTSEESYPDLD